MAEPKIIVWDIDGVLIAAGRSYRQTIINTTQYYFADLIGFPLTDKLLSWEDTQSFKLAGGFNDDWELTYSAILCYLAKLISESKASVQGPYVPPGDLDGLSSKLKAFGRTCGSCALKLNIQQITSKAAAAGGGMAGVEKVLIQMFGDSVAKAKVVWFPALIKQVFEEMYLGSKLFSKKYGISSTFYSGEGLISKEDALADIGTLLELRKKYYFGVATGRERFEAEFSLRAHGFSRLFPSELIVSLGDTAEKKPSPQPLLECRKRICHKYTLPADTPAMYIGDSIDDFAAAKAAGFLFVAVVGGVPDPAARERMRAMFHDKMADLIVDEIEELPLYM
jgi:HAD superfamily hydrolase (TIGR01548 family)